MQKFGFQYSKKKDAQTYVHCRPPHTTFHQHPSSPVAAEPILVPASTSLPYAVVCFCLVLVGFHTSECNRECVHFEANVHTVTWRRQAEQDLRVVIVQLAKYMLDDGQVKRAQDDIIKTIKNISDPFHVA